MNNLLFVVRTVLFLLWKLVLFILFLIGVSVVWEGINLLRM